MLTCNSGPPRALPVDTVNWGAAPYVNDLAATAACYINSSTNERATPRGTGAP